MKTVAVLKDALLDALFSPRKWFCRMTHIKVFHSKKNHGGLAQHLENTLFPVYIYFHFHTDPQIYPNY